MAFADFGKQVGRVILAAAFVAASALASPSNAHPRHGNGAGIALGIIGGILAGAAIASAAAPPYYAPPPAYYYPYAPRAYSAAPAYSYAPPQAYYAPTPYYGAPSYYGYGY
jgi:hypothetical protein